MSDLTCDACGKQFHGTPSQRNHLKYGESKKSYCSKACQNSNQNKHLRKPLSGPCPTCGVMFKSRGTKEKIFCTMACYTASPGFKERIAAECLKNAAKSRGVSPTNWEPFIATCIECDKKFRDKPGNKAKFCTQICYRKYMSKRFDRWIASPQEVALPQAFDEFLTSEILPCLVKGCDWKGHHLSLHMNQAHGVPADHFKRLAGFNLGSGIVSLPLHESLCDRDLYGVAKADVRNMYLSNGPQKQKTMYKSLEGKEHRAKTRALQNETEPKPMRICVGCGVTFQQSTIFGETKYHSIACREAHYKATVKMARFTLSCVVCGTAFQGTRQQQLSAERGNPVCCSHSCKGILNGSKPKPSARGVPRARGAKP